MIKYRPYRDEDLFKIEKFQDETAFPVRHLLITERLATKDDEVVAYGNVRLIPEANIILDHEKLTKREKVLILSQMLEVAEKDTKRLNTFLHLHAFCIDEQFALILENHFGYQASDRKLVTLRLYED